ncbi:MAG: type II secretion system F family protein [Methylococcales bacterium]|nr:type II secretion system F family protein [Methylococcales bacterium]
MNDIEYKLNRALFKMDAAGRRRLWTKLSKLINNGVPILDALGSMHARRVENGNPKHPTTLALADWMDKLKNGRRLSQAIDGWVDRDEQMLLAAGEQSGKLDEALTSAAEVMEAKKKIRGAVIGGLIYPVVMMCIAIGVLIMFSFKIIPSFTGIVPDEKWHGIARFMIDLANFSRSWIWLIVAIIIAVITAFFVSLPRWSEGFRIKLDKYPPYSVYRMLQGSTWMISFAALVSAGVRIENALQQLSEGASPWLLARVQSCLRGMRSGLHAGDALAKSGYGFPDLEIIDDLGVYSKLSGFDQALSIIGREWIKESVESIQVMMKVIFGISLLFVGMFVAFMVGGLVGMELQMADIMQTSYR